MLPRPMWGAAPQVARATSLSFVSELALENDLEIIPVINKIDMEGARIPETTDQIVDLIGCKPEDIVHASGKSDGAAKAEGAETQKVQYELRQRPFREHSA